MQAISGKGCTSVCAAAQASIGTALLGLLTMADVLIGGYVVVLDECIKERRLVRTKPYQLDLDDALALTDDDALAKDMFARPSANGPQSYYMQVHPVNAGTDCCAFLACTPVPKRRSCGGHKKTKEYSCKVSDVRAVAAPEVK